MRRLAVVALATTVVVPAAVGHAEPRRRETRVMVAGYEPAWGRIFIDPNMPGVSAAEAEFEPERGERAVTVTLEDRSGLPARGIVAQTDRFLRFCGETPEPFELANSLDPVVVRVYSGVCGERDAGLATRGAIRVTFYGAARP